MNKNTLMTLALSLVAPLCLAGDNAVETAKLHFTNIVKRDFAQLSKTYAAEVRLMPGHEMLEKSNLGKDGDGQARSVDVTREKLLAAINAFPAQERSPARIEIDRKMLEGSVFEALEAGEGDFAINPKRPLKTPDGKLHFSIKKDDVLVRIGPPKGQGRSNDHFLLQLRMEKGSWKVVAEYLPS
jgi:hypothetical protein